MDDDAGRKALRRGDGVVLEAPNLARPRDGELVEALAAEDLEWKRSLTRTQRVSKRKRRILPELQQNP